MINRAHWSSPLEKPLCRWREDKAVKFSLKSKGKRVKSRSSQRPWSVSQRECNRAHVYLPGHYSTTSWWNTTGDSTWAFCVGIMRRMLILHLGLSEAFSMRTKIDQTFHVICSRISQMFPCRNLKQNTKRFNITYKAGPEPNLYGGVLCLPIVLHVPVKSASCFGY